MTEQQFQDLAQIFLEHLFEDLDKNKIKLKEYWDVDHLCYRAGTDDSYDFLKKEISTFAQFLIETEVNGRNIATFKLNHSIKFKTWEIDLVELPAPKKLKAYPDGFEHIEVVCDLSFEELKNKYQHLKLDLRGISKDINQEFKIELGKHNLKFHHLSLASVINLEQNKKVMNSLINSKILKIFKKNEPLIAGTFPLKLETIESDVDLLLKANDLDFIENRLKENFGQCFKFKTERTTIDGLKLFVFKNASSDL